MRSQPTAAVEFGRRKKAETTTEEDSMAVPGRRNGMMEDDDNDVEDGLYDDVALDVDSDTPLHLREIAAAVQIGDVDALRLALDNLTSCIDEAIEDGDTALHLACLYGHLPCVQVLLERGASLEVKDEDGAIPLHDACAGGYTEIVQFLFNIAPSQECVRRMLEAVDVEADTPLHHAARGEHIDVIRVLLAHGSPTTKKNNYDKVPSELAEDPEVRALLEAAASSVAS